MPGPSRRDRTASIDQTRPSSANYHANALARGLGLLEQMAAAAEPLTLTAFSEHTGLPKSTVVRLLSVLCEMEYAVRVGDPPTYRLGHNVQRLAAGYVSALDLRAVADRHLAPLAERTGQTANLGVLDGGQVLHVCVSEPNRPLRFLAATGTRDHLYCTGLGKQLLAHVPDDLLPTCVPPEPFPAHTDRTITTLEELRRGLRQIRRRGHSLDDNERSTGLRCVAVPIMIDGECLAAISVSGPSGEFVTAQQNEYVTELRAVADALIADPDFEVALRIAHRSLRAAGAVTAAD